MFFASSRAIIIVLGFSKLQTVLLSLGTRRAGEAETNKTKSLHKWSRFSLELRKSGAGQWLCTTWSYSHTA